MDVETKIEGLAELEARLTELDALAGQKLLTRVLRKVARPMKEAATQNAYTMSRHGSSGALAKSVALAGRRPMGGEVARVAVTSKGRDRTAVYLQNAFYGRKRRGVYYGWMVDQGHRVASRRTGSLRKAGRSSGGHAGAVSRVPGKFWFSNAVNATQGQAISAFRRELESAVARLEKRTGKTASPDSLVSDR